MNVIKNEIIEIRGVNFNSVTMDEAVEICRNMLNEKNNHPHIIHTPNSEIVQLCVEKNEYYKLINSADLIIPDGFGVIMASKILKKPLVNGKVAGVELVERLCELAAECGYGVFFLGGKPKTDTSPSVANMAAHNLQIKYPKLIISGTHDGFFKNNDEIISEINNSGAQILFVCTGVPRQEQWMYECKEKLTSVRLAGGFGGSVDIYAGTVKRAPKAFIRLNCEWLYRLLCEPSRIGRMMKLPKFIIGTIFAKK